MIRRTGISRGEIRPSTTREQASWLSRRPPRDTYQLFVLLLSIFGVGLAYVGALAAGREIRARLWPTVRGEIQQVLIRQDTVGVYVGKFGNAVVRADRLRIRYNYSVSAAPYVGTRIGMSNDASRAVGKRDKYSVGQEVQVHYNPSDPSDAVLELSYGVRAIIGMLVGLLMILAAYALYVLHLRPPKPAASP